MIVLSSVFPNSMMTKNAFLNAKSTEMTPDEVAKLLTYNRHNVTTHIPYNNSAMAITDTIGMRVSDDGRNKIKLDDVGDVLIWARYTGPYMAQDAHRMPHGGIVEFIKLEVMEPEVEKPKVEQLVEPEPEMPVDDKRPIVGITLEDFRKMLSFPIHLGDFVLDNKLVKLVTHYRNASVFAVIDDHAFMVNHLTHKNVLDYMEGLK